MSSEQEAQPEPKSFREMLDDEIANGNLKDVLKATVRRIYGQRGIKLDKSSLDDHIQEIYLQVCRSEKTFDVSKPLLPWVMRVASNVLLSRMRDWKRASRHVRSLSHDDFWIAVNAKYTVCKPDTISVRHLDALLEAMSELDEKDRGTILLRMELNDVALAEAIGVSTVEAARARACRAVKKLKTKFFRLLAMREVG